jgi:hypothetical protein
MNKEKSSNVGQSWRNMGCAVCTLIQKKEMNYAEQREEMKEL